MFQVFSLLTGDQPCVRFSWKERIESARARTPWTSRGLDIKKKKVDSARKRMQQSNAARKRMQQENGCALAQRLSR